jgi:signal transduction histidine kinase
MTNNKLPLRKTVPGDIAMELKCVVAIPLLRFLRDKRGEREMACIVSETGMTVEYLENANNWISYDCFCALLRKLVEVTGDERAPFDAALWHSNRTSYRGIGLFVIHMGTPSMAYRLAADYHRLWDTICEWQVKTLKNNRCIIAVRYPKHKQDKNNCLALQGSLAAIPHAFGLPSATIIEKQCACDGADSCAYDINWVNKPARAWGLNCALAGSFVGALLAFLGDWSVGIAFTSLLFPLLGYFMGREMDYRLRLGSVYRQNEEQAASLVESVRAIEALNRQLEQRVRERTTQLEAANKELEAFSYSVSHDLRSPLRSIDGFSLAVLQDNADRLDAPSVLNLQRVQASAQRMGLMIDSLLALSRVTQQGIRSERVDLSQAAEAIAQDLRQKQPERAVEFAIAKDLVTHGDAVLLRIVMQNLLDNAWKYTSKNQFARIEFGIADISSVSTCPFKSEIERRKAPIFFVRDNGAGFDMRYANKLFGAFQRLHTEKEFGGTGIGLATVQRIIHRHGGEVWAESEVGKGATFYFAL